MTRNEDKNPGGSGQKASLDARVKISKDAEADLFVAIHVDAASNSSADKVTVYTKISANDVSNTLANNVIQSLTGVAVTSQGISKKEAVHQVTRSQNGNVGAILLEVGYLTNGSQEKLFNDDAYLQKLGNAIGDGIFNTAYPNKKETQTAPNPPTILGPFSINIGGRDNTNVTLKTPVINR
jgi:N-acetylmuramoyl-L-alanine amidase